MSAKQNAQGWASGRPKTLGFFEIDREGFAAFLRKAHRFDVAAEAGRRLGIPAKTVRNWLEQVCAPSGDNILKIAIEYGPDALAAMFPHHAPGWMQRAVREERAAKLEAEMAGMQAELEALRAQIGNFNLGGGSDAAASDRA